ncbi:MAG: PQQ-binding-like beta-propeller repeat protein [Planctomycetes bacterium]|nr:PQQ-binding-like beta-propeller repeat protein [Planctomycetota bacterium]
MRVAANFCSPFVVLFVQACAGADDWPSFRGPSENGSIKAKNLPAEWSQDNFLWKTKLPGLGSSTPITVGDKVFVTCYAGYGAKLIKTDFSKGKTKGDAKGGAKADPKGDSKGETKGEAKGDAEPEDQKNLKLLLVCIDRTKGNIAWTKEIEPKLPEQKFNGFIREHGYASSTPVSDGERIYVFFGKSGVFAFDLKGNQLWQADVGSRTDGWGSASSPALSKNTVIVNAAIESRSLVGLDKKTGKELWRKEKIAKNWVSPVLVNLQGGKQEVVLNAPGKILGFDPDSGAELWSCDGIGKDGDFGYTCSTPAVHKDMLYAMGAGPGMPPTLIAVRAGGRGDVTKTHLVWKEKAGAGISSPTIHNGKIYWVNNAAVCVDADTGKSLYKERVYSSIGEYTSTVAADGKVFALTRVDGLYVLAEGEKFEKLAHNSFDGDDSIFNSSPAISNDRIYIRSNAYLYCIGKK